MGSGAPSLKNSSKESSRKKKKSTKSKKRRRHDSSSSPSPSSSLSLSDDSGDSLVRRKVSSSRGRRKQRDELKKRARRSPSESLPRRKKKGLSKRKKVDSERERSKRGRKLKRKRNASVSPSSSSDSSKRRRRSRSCAEDSVSEYHSRGSLDRRGRSSQRERDNSGLKRVVNERRHSVRHRSPSCSSCSGSSRSGRSCSKERFADRNHSRRQSSETESRDRRIDEEERVEITQDYADFPSSRSNDSFEGGNRKDSRRTVEDGRAATGDVYADWEEADVRREEKESSAVASAQYGENSNEGGSWYCGETDLLPYESQSAKEPRVKSKVVIPAVPAEPDDLELLLRQKALENLKKYRGGLSAIAKSSGEQKDGFIQNEPCEVAGGRVETKHAKQSAKSTDTTPKQKASSSVNENQHAQLASCPPECRGKSASSASVQVATVTGAGEQNNRNQTGNRPNVNASSKLVTCRTYSSSTPNPKKCQDIQNQLQKEQENSNKNSLKQTLVGNNMPISGAAKGPASHATENEISKAEGSTSKPSSTCDQATELGNTNQSKSRDTELENKTMTVMRGGEMVQVSYKVYIPKKTPALARRQLQR